MDRCQMQRKLAVAEGNIVATIALIALDPDNEKNESRLDAALGDLTRVLGQHLPGLLTTPMYLRELGELLAAWLQDHRDHFGTCTRENCECLPCRTAVALYGSGLKEETIQ